MKYKKREQAENERLFISGKATAYNDVLEKIVENPDLKKIELFLNKEIEKTAISIEERDKIINLFKKEERKCWRNEGCLYNSNTSSKYMRCWLDDYSVNQCEADHIKK